MHYAWHVPGIWISSLILLDKNFTYIQLTFYAEQNIEHLLFFCLAPPKGGDIWKSSSSYFQVFVFDSRKAADDCYLRVWIFLLFLYSSFSCIACAFLRINYDIVNRFSTCNLITGSATHSSTELNVNYQTLYHRCHKMTMVAMVTLWRPLRM